MESLITLLSASLPLNALILVVVIVIYLKVKDLCNRLGKLENDYSNRFKWCIDHFAMKGGETKHE